LNTFGKTMALSSGDNELQDDSRSDGEVLLDKWAREFREPLLRFFRKRAPNTVEPDDLVQEVLVRLARRADLATIERVEGYLFQTAANVLADRYRSDGRQPEFIESYQDSVHGKVVLTPERVFIDRQALDDLVKALYALPERTRHIFTLYHFENIRQAKIADLFGMPISTVEKHMARANKHLLKRLGRKK
jgi:RNA polymerase sigma factor (sigma-70 family)